MSSPIFQFFVVGWRQCFKYVGILEGIMQVRKERTSMGSLRYCGDPKAGTSTPKSETIVDWGSTVARGCVDTGARYRKTCAFSFVFSFQLSRRVRLTVIGSAGWSIAVCSASQSVQYGRLGHFFYILGEKIYI